MLNTVVISDEDVCCSVVFGTLVGVFVFSDMWSECQCVECVFTSLVRTECGVFVMCCMQCCMYVRVSCFVMCGCAVSRRYIDVCNCDTFSVYHEHFKFCVVCIDGLRYVCCSECNVVSNG